MKVEIVLKPDLKELHIVIYTDEITKEIQQIADRLSSSQTKILTGTKEQKIFLLNPGEIYCFYSENQKVFVKTENGDKELVSQRYVPKIKKYLGI